MKPINPDKQYDWVIVDNSKRTYLLHQQTRFEAGETLRTLLNDNKDIDSADLYRLTDKPVITGTAKEVRKVVLYAV